MSFSPTFPPLELEDQTEMGWKTTECSPNPGALTIRNPYLAAALFLIPRSFPLRSACNGWCSLPSFPTVARGSKRLLRERKSMLWCLSFGERKHLNDMMVAITATFSWLIVRPTCPWFTLRMYFGTSSFIHLLKQQGPQRSALKFHRVLSPVEALYVKYVYNF